MRQLNINLYIVLLGMALVMSVTVLLIDNNRLNRVCKKYYDEIQQLTSDNTNLKCLVSGQMMIVGTSIDKNSEIVDISGHRFLFSEWLVEDNNYLLIAKPNEHSCGECMETLLCSGYEMLMASNVKRFAVIAERSILAQIREMNPSKGVDLFIPESWSDNVFEDVFFLIVSKDGYIKQYCALDTGMDMFNQILTII